MYGIDRIPAALPAHPGRGRARSRLPDPPRAGARASSRPPATWRRSTSPSSIRRATPPSPACGRRRSRCGWPIRSPSSTRCCGARWCRTWWRPPASTSAGALAAVRMFEIATVFYRALGRRRRSRTSPSTSGWSAAAGWAAPGSGEVELDFFDLKGALEGLAEPLRRPPGGRPADAAGSAGRQLGRAAPPTDGRWRASATWPGGGGGGLSALRGRAGHGGAGRRQPEPGDRHPLALSRASRPTSR